MRVCLLTNRVAGGGAELVAVRWAAGLADRGHEVLLLAYDEPAPAPLPGVRVLGYPSARRGRRLVELPRWVRGQVQAHGAEAAVGVMTYANLVLQAGLAGTGVPVLLSEHNLSSNLRDEGRGGRAKDAVARLAYRRADAVLACSHAVAAEVSGRYGVPVDRVWVVPNPSAGSPRTLPPGTSRRVLLVGRLVEQKRPRAFVDLLQELADRGSPAAGVMLGAGPLETAVRERIAGTSLAVDLPGWQVDWRSRARAGDVVVLLSLQEGFGNVLVEAAECGLPVVAVSQALGVADAIIPGVTGVLAPSGSVAHLADAVQDAWRLPAPPAELVQRWAARFTQPAAAAALEQVLVAVRR